MKNIYKNVYDVLSKATHLVNISTILQVHFSVTDILNYFWVIKLLLD